MFLYWEDTVYSRFFYQVGEWTAPSVFFYCLSHCKTSSNTPLRSPSNTFANEDCCVDRGALSKVGVASAFCPPPSILLWKALAPVIQFIYQLHLVPLFYISMLFYQILCSYNNHVTLQCKRLFLHFKILKEHEGYKIVRSNTECIS